MKLTGYAFPWDFVGDERAAARVAALEPDAVALAATYHAARLATPLHPTRRVLEIADSACYVPVREDVWRGRRLKPSSPRWIHDPDVFGTAYRALAAHGIASDAWIVLCHDDTLGRANPDVATRNAFGDHYAHALCPASSEVREYVETLVEEVVEAHPVRGVVLEACGPIGVEHASLHDKIEFAQWSSVDHALLSLCFCDACRLAMSEAGLDSAEVAVRVRAGVGGAAPDVDAVLGPEVASSLADLRQSLTATLVQECVERVRRVSPDARITLHAAADPWTTGSFCPAGAPGALKGVDAVIANGWDEEAGPIRLSQLRAVAGPHRDLGVYARLDRGWPGISVTREVERLSEAGVEELHLYHLGLWPEAHWRVANDVVTMMRGAAS